MPHRPLRETMLDPTTNDHHMSHRPLRETILDQTINDNIRRIVHCVRRCSTLMTNDY
jgi:hypothetical protein